MGAEVSDQWSLSFYETSLDLPSWKQETLAATKSPETQKICLIQCTFPYYAHPALEGYTISSAILFQTSV